MAISIQSIILSERMLSQKMNVTFLEPYSPVDISSWKKYGLDFQLLFNESHYISNNIFSICQTKVRLLAHCVLHHFWGKTDRAHRH